MTEDASPLFTPVTIGDLTLPNRIAMAPLTRNRAIDPNTVPSPLAPLYYRQRDGAGLLITEATQISQQGQGYVWTPGCFTEEQVEAWQARHRRRCMRTAAIYSCSFGTSGAYRMSRCNRTAARPSRPRRSPPRPRRSSRAVSPTSPRRARSRPRRSPASSPTMRTRPHARAAPASTASNCTAPTAI